MSRQPLVFIASDEIAVADHTNGDPIAVDDRNRADLVVEQPTRDISCRFVRARGYDLRRHDVSGPREPFNLGAV
jgi:hypothetical protein